MQQRTLTDIISNALLVGIAIFLHSLCTVHSALWIFEGHTKIPRFQGAWNSRLKPQQLWGVIWPNMSLLGQKNESLLGHIVSNISFNNLFPTTTKFCALLCSKCNGSMYYKVTSTCWCGSGCITSLSLLSKSRQCQRRHMEIHYLNSEAIEAAQWAKNVHEIPGILNIQAIFEWFWLYVRVDRRSPQSPLLT